MVLLRKKRDSRDFLGADLGPKCSGRGSSKCKGPEVGNSSMSFSNKKKANEMDFIADSALVLKGAPQDS